MVCAFDSSKSQGKMSEILEKSGNFLRGNK